MKAFFYTTSDNWNVGHLKRVDVILLGQHAQNGICPDHLENLLGFVLSGSAQYPSALACMGVAGKVLMVNLFGGINFGWSTINPFLTVLFNLGQASRTTMSSRRGMLSRFREGC